MSGGVVLLVNLVVAAALLVLALAYPSLRRASRRSLSLAALPLAVPPTLLAAVLSAYVFGEDSYRGNGISRWEAYRSPGGALGPMFVLSVALMCACAVLIVCAGRRGDVRLLCGTALAGGLTSLVLVTATVIGFTAN
jgi:hypothetical protein